MFSSFAEKEPNMDKSNAYLLWFEQLERKDVDIVGGKSSSLGEMTSCAVWLCYDGPCLSVFH